MVIGAYWARFIGVDIIFYLAILLGAFFGLKKYVFEKEVTNKLYYILPAIFLLIFASQFLVLGHTASNDGLHSVLVGIIEENNKIPDQYLPYSEIPFTYTVGYHSMASFFHLEPFILNWAFGLFFIFLIFCLLLMILSERVNSKLALVGIISLLGTKMIYLEFFYGMYPRLLGSVFILATIYLFSKKNKAWIIPFIALFMTHPIYAISGFLWLLFEAVYHKRFKELKYILLIPIIGLPVILQSYYAYGVNLFSQIGGPNQTIGIITLILFFGVPTISLFLFAILSLLHRIKMKIKIDAWTKKYLAFFIFLFILAYVTSGLFTALYTAFVSAASFVLIIFIFITLNKDQLIISKIRKVHNKKIILIVLFLFTLFICSNIFISGDIKQRMYVGKITPHAAEFAFSFIDFDSNRVPVLFIANSGGKIAEYSNKIPFDVTNGYFLPYDPAQTIKTPAYFDMLAKKEAKKNILADCKNSLTNDLIYDTNTKYIVVDELNYFCKIEKEVLYTHNHFVVYNNR
jgi:hypothetical protein